MDVLERALEILRDYPLCDSCLGRQFARLGYGLENRERGKAIKDMLHMRLVWEYRGGAAGLEDLKALARVHGPTRRFLASVGVAVEEARCHVCGGLMEDVERYAQAGLEAVDAVEFETFEVGTVVPRDMLEREAELVKRFLITTGEPVKHEINRRIGREILARLPGKRVDKARPQLVIRIDVSTGAADVLRNPLLIYGKYVKLTRAMSQVQPLGGVSTLAKELDYIRELAGGKGLVIHAAGREDVDVRALGPGRPLVVEVKEPSRYNVDPPPLANARVIFTPLGPATRSDVRRLKAKSRTDVKLYRALIYLDVPATPEALERLRQLEGKVVTQRTPRRIRRLDPRKRRTRMVYQLAARPVTPHVLELYIRCQGGLYVKEFIHGDGGRTTPSVAEALGAAPEVLELDVLAVE